MRLFSSPYSKCGQNALARRRCFVWAYEREGGREGGEGGREGGEGGGVQSEQTPVFKCGEQCTERFFTLEIIWRLEGKTLHDA